MLCFHLPFSPSLSVYLSMFFPIKTSEYPIPSKIPDKTQYPYVSIPHIFVSVKYKKEHSFFYLPHKKIEKQFEKFKAHRKITIPICNNKAHSKLQRLKCFLLRFNSNKNVFCDVKTLFDRLNMYIFRYVIVCRVIFKPCCLKSSCILCNYILKVLF